MTYPLSVFNAPAYLFDPATGQPYDAANPQPIKQIGGGATTGVTPTSRSGSITVGGTPQVVMAANATRLGYFFQNNSSGPLWISELSASPAATQPAVLVAAGLSIGFTGVDVPVTAISVFGATTGQTYTAREW